MKFNKRARRAIEIVDTPSLWELIIKQVAPQVADDARDAMDVEPLHEPFPPPQDGARASAPSLLLRMNHDIGDVIIADRY